jgi:serine/threonine protein kinase
MESRPASSAMKHIPTPPGHLFRVLKRLSASDTTATYLCLPRDLTAATEPPEVPDPDFSERFESEHAAFGSLPSLRMHTQLKLLEGPSTETYMLESRLSTLRKRHVALLPQLVVVKMATASAHLRHDIAAIEALGAGREYSSLHVGSTINRAQLTASPESSWVCLRPVFGWTLREFGENYVGGLPSWFVAHIFVELLESLEYVHRNEVAGGFAYNALSASSVVLNPYPSYFHYRYRGYPDVVLMDFGAARPWTISCSGKDARNLLEMLDEMVRKWSDTAPWVKTKVVGSALEGNDPMILLLRDIQGVLDDNGAFSLSDVKRWFGLRLEKIRASGPPNFPQLMAKDLHADLATEEELEHALRKPTVLKFGSQKHQLNRFEHHTPVAVGLGGHAGMKTNRIIVIRFTSLKAGFFRVVGEGYVEDEEDIVGDMAAEDVVMEDGHVKVEEEMMTGVVDGQDDDAKDNYVSLFGGK